MLFSINLIFCLRLNFCFSPSIKQFDYFVFTKMYLELDLFKAGLLEAVDNFIASQTITNEQGQTLPLRRLYDTALTFSEDNEYFDKFKSELQTILGLTDEQVEEILSNCIARTP